MANAPRFRDRVRDRISDLGGGAADTFAALCVVGMVGGAVGLVLTTSPVWIPVFFVARAEEHSFQRKLWTSRGY